MEKTPVSRLKIAPSVSTKVVDGEAVVVSFLTGNYYVLDPVSAFFWAQVEKQPISVEEIQAQVLEEFETTPEESRQNIENFCRYMLQEKLLTSAD